MQNTAGLPWLQKLVLFISLFKIIQCGSTNECMSRVSTDGPCSFPSNDSKTESKRLVECMDSCLSSSVACRGIQWDSKHQLCNRYSSPRPAQRQRGCLVFRIGCQTPSDIICMKSVYINKFRPGTLIPSVKEEMNCRILCTIWESCLGVTWYAQKDACEVHEELQNTITGMSDYRDVMAVKDLKCSARYLTMTLNVQTKDYTTTAIGSFTACTKLINNTKCKSVIWKASRRKCFANLKSDDSELSWESGSARIHKSNTGQGTDVCYTKTVGKMVDGGFILGGGISEKDCLRFCQKVRNCALVSHQSTSKVCTFLRIVIERRNIPPFNMYAIRPCSDSKTFRSTYFFKKDTSIKKPPKKGNSVRQKDTGSDVKTGSDLGVYKNNSVLPCAVQCASTKSCTSLKYNTEGIHKRCALNPKSDTRFVKLVHP